MIERSRWWIFFRKFFFSVFFFFWLSLLSFEPQKKGGEFTRLFCAGLDQAKNSNGRFRG